MDVSEFVNGLAAGGMPFADTDDDDYCPDHGYDVDLYHHVRCEIYAAKLGLD